MNHIILRPCVLFLSLFISLSFSLKAQNFEVSGDVCDSLSPNSYLIHISGYATFTDSMILEIELRTEDTLNTVIYSGYKDFGVGGLSTLTNFTFDPLTEVFTLDIGVYSTRDYVIHIMSMENGELKEELLIDTF